MNRLCKIKYFFCILCFTFLMYYLIYTQTKHNFNENNVKEAKDIDFVVSAKTSENQLENTIRIASVMCPRPGDKFLRDELDVLLKSVAISTLFYKTADNIEFHFVLSNEEDEQYFQSKIKEYNHPTSQAQLSLYVYSADDAVSKYYPDGMKEEERYFCHYLRIFLPKILKETDAVIYFDTDVIITGNLQDLWNKFHKMKEEQIVGMGPDLTVINPRNTSEWFGDLPYVPPKAVNSGVQLMNLTRMRQFAWVEKHLKLYNEYVFEKGVELKSDQKLSNIVLYLNPAFFLELPCHFNFWANHCLEGFYCETAFTDPYGIQVLHGAGEGFSEEHAFSEIFKRYKDFNFTSNNSKSDIVNQFMIPIRDYYALNFNDKNLSGNITGQFCERTLAQLLFKRVFN